MRANIDVEERVVANSNNHYNHEGIISNESDRSIEEKPSEPEYDTGLKAWLQVLGSFFLFFNSWGVINTWGAYQTYYEENLLTGVSSSSLAWIGSLQSFLLMLFGVVTGPLFDAGYFRALITFGTFMLPFGLMMTSLSTTYYQVILAQGVCIGLGSGCLFVPGVAILPQYFSKKRALANGLAASGSSGVLYPIVFDQLQQKVGFPWACRIISFIALGTCCISLSLMQIRFKPAEKRKLLQLSAFKELPYVLFTAGMFLGFLGFYNYLVYAQPYALDTGIVGTNLGFYLLAILNAGSTISRIGMNFLADHTGPLNMLTPCAISTSILAFAWIGVHNAPGIVILTALYGCASGGFVSLPPVVMASITKDMGSMGTRLGQVFAITSIALLIGTPIGGAILSSTGSYLGVQLFTGCCIITASALFAGIRFMRSGPKLIAKV